MKFCPYCGAPLQDPAASFCSECGKKFVPVQNEEAPEQKPKRRLFRSFPQKRKQKPKKGAVGERGAAPVDGPLSDEEADCNYDGYYEDVLPADLGKKREPVDRTLVIKILVLGAAVFLIISGCVAALYLL